MKAKKNRGLASRGLKSLMSVLELLSRDWRQYGGFLDRGHRVKPAEVCQGGSDGTKGGCRSSTLG
jgi:hypothetical protein